MAGPENSESNKPQTESKPDGSSESNKPQTESKPEVGGSNVSDVKDVLIVKGKDSEIKAEGALFNMGFASGNPSNALPGIGGMNMQGGGTTDSFQAESGGKLILNGAVLNTGAYASDVISQEIIRRRIPNQPVVPQSNYGTVGYGDAHLDSSVAGGIINTGASWGFGQLLRFLWHVLYVGLLKLMGLDKPTPKGK